MLPAYAMVGACWLFCRPARAVRDVPLDAIHTEKVLLRGTVRDTLRAFGKLSDIWLGRRHTVLTAFCLALMRGIHRIRLIEAGILDTNARGAYSQDFLDSNARIAGDGIMD